MNILDLLFCRWARLCVGPEVVIPALLSVGSAYMQAKSNERVTNRQDSLNQQRNAYLLANSEKTRGAIDKYLGTTSPENKTVDTANVQNEITQGLDKSVDTTRGFEVPNSFGGRVTKSYGTQKLSDTAAADARIKKAIANLAIIGTPQELAARDSANFTKALTDIGVNNNAASNVSGTYDRAMTLAQPGSGEALAGDVLSGLSLAAVAKLNQKKPGYTVPPGGV